MERGGLLGRHSDLHLKADDLARSLAFPGPIRLAEAHLGLAAELLELCQSIGRDDFTVEHLGVTWRGRRDRLVVDGIWYRLRRLPDAPPRLDALPSPLPRHVQAMLMSERLQPGGLVYVTGAAGAGKTTTASAMVVSRLARFGGIAYTIEDPPEMPLNGWHGDGYCSQTTVAGDSSADWMESFRGALRSQPAATHQMLFVGEIRNRESAQLMLRAASNGFLVVATGFGTDIVSALDSLAKLAGAEHQAMLGNMVRLVIHQRLRDGRLEARALASPSASGPVAARIRGGQFVHLVGDIQQQEALMIRNISPLEVQDHAA
ncbi:twitching motility protein PilT [Tepidamorphus gemmatus]|uniref:Twitching motility protein PilT n=1 Tax=Tepidamorphus gemmatus TaxID=747076 RepID=A0A4R3MBK5_9HYPH|nr:ATPase, T2SS/T4P/T4SS family [Tepidamorphus gemmatus]TCT10726.1 twitching motility protein PilT [Tepidamorphus gemmatus]